MTKKEKIFMAIGIALTVALLSVYFALSVKNYRLIDELNISQMQHEFDIQKLTVEKSGKYYFQDSLFAVEIIISDSVNSGRVKIPINLNEKIQVQAKYGDGYFTKKIRDVICK